MSTPLDKRGYMFTESYGPKQHYRLVIGFESLDDLHAAQDFILNREQKQPRMETRSLQCPAPGCRNTVMQGCFRGDCPATKETAVGCICRSVASLQARPDCPIHGMKETSSAPNTKGSFGSECNRSSCKNMPATWKHRDLQNRYYCQPCGIWINEQNGELLCAPAPNR